MTPTGIVFFLPGDGSQTPEGKPLMLQPILFCPALAWAARRVLDCGIRRFFLVCDPAFSQEAAACIPGEAQVTLASFSDYLQKLPAFLEGGDVLLANRPMLPAGTGRALLQLSAPQALAAGQALKTLSHGQAASIAFTAFDSFSALQALAPLCRDEIVRRHTQQGVSVVDPAAVYIDPRVSIGRGTVLLPGCILRGETTVGSGCEIGPNSMLTDCRVGDGCVINASQAVESSIGSESRIGPFSYLRPNSTVADHVKIGDFVEVKNSVIGAHSSVAHLTYVGDSDVGEQVNFGCGTVTTNYDGAKKARCTIGSRSFIGCNTNLVAPVTVGEGAYIAAGSTITKDVPADSLAIARTREQTVKENWAAKRRALLKSKY